MSATSTEARSPAGGLAFSNNRNIIFAGLKLLGLMLLDAMGLIMVYGFLYDDNLGLAVIFGVITLFANVVIFVPQLYPLKWMAPGLMLVTLLVIYPIFYTVATAFTNYGDGHLFTKDQAISLISERGFVPEDATTYDWVAFRRGDDDYALWLTDDEGNVEFAVPDEPVQTIDLAELTGVTPSEDGLPNIEGYTVVDDPVAALEGVESLSFSDPIDEVFIAPLNLEQRYIYDFEQGLTLDQERGRVYDTTLYVDEGGDFALWLTLSGLNAVDEGIYILPGEDMEEVEVNDRAALREAEIQLAVGTTIPESIAGFERVGTAADFTQSLDGLVLEEVDDGLATGDLDFSQQFIFDPAQGITLDQIEGDDYETTVIVNEAGEYGLVLDGGRSGVFIARPDEPVLIDGIPAEYEGYEQAYTNLARSEALSFLQTIENDYFGEEGDTIGVVDTRTAGRPYVLRYEYDEEAGAFTDLATGDRYIADDDIGAFVLEGSNDTSNALSPGYRVNVGLDNFTRFIEDPALRGPLIDIFVWTVTFALLSVLTTFVVGLFMAIVLNDPLIPGRPIIRSLLIIPYAIPGVIAIVVWRGLLNQNLGIVTNVIVDLTGYRIPWFADPWWAKVAIILVNLWLGYPYMMLVCSGALQAIPSDIYEAASVDGASTYHKFWNITLPLLLVTVGPLLIASFSYNFNNYLMIEALTEGGPPVPGSPVQAGYSDILISYTYNQAFGSGRGADFGYASAIAIVIFALVGVVTLFQYRFTRTWEEVGENV